MYFFAQFLLARQYLRSPSGSSPGSPPMARFPPLIYACHASTIYNKDAAHIGLHYTNYGFITYTLVQVDLLS